MVGIPRLVVAAPASGGGKTTVATGLMAAFSARGLAVSPHKVGPDYIDPGYHSLATGRPGRNLDPYLTSEELIGPLFLHGAAGADIAVVEGVMGLYDGAVGQGDFASTAHVAKLLRAPVVLVVDASSAARSIAAVVHGFMTFDSGSEGRVRLGGVILNRIGSDRHEEICREAVEALGVPVLGVLRRHDGIATPSRHLGLIPVAERHADAVETVARLGGLIAETCDLDALLELAHGAPPLTVRPWSAGDAVEAGPGRPVVAVAGGPAFTFGYAEQVELLRAAGAEVVTFDPLREERLPEGAGGLVIGGGFPEVYASELAANRALLAEVGRFSGAVYAECAGLLYLTKALDGVPLAGVVDASAEMTARLTLGYRSAVAVADSVVARAGERVRGHEFHRTAVTPGRGGVAAWQWSTEGAEGFVQGTLLASYLHLHWAGTPWFARRFADACGRT
ncbi:cobyrinate a,c-diamide synthase [Actinocorallia longicatena]|uniref:Hydrogenobyrinate a,c-diamide synthase n=1 Tax=Actinocorallia longicatena TaxID=111803 RepID=A0ABP6QGU7_9ACTN